jgi:hypothetical protein
MRPTYPEAQVGTGYPGTRMERKISQILSRVTCALRTRSLMSNTVTWIRTACGTTSLVKPSPYILTMTPTLVPSLSARTFRKALPEPHTALTGPFSGKPTLLLAGSFISGEIHGPLAVLVSRIGPLDFRLALAIPSTTSLAIRPLASLQYMISGSPSMKDIGFTQSSKLNLPKTMDQFAQTLTLIASACERREPCVLITG